MSISKRGITKNKDIVQKDNSSLNHVNINKSGTIIELESTKDGILDLEYRGQSYLNNNTETYNLFDVNSGVDGMKNPVEVDGTTFRFKGPLNSITRILHFKCSLKKDHHYLVRGIFKNIGRAPSFFDESQLGFYEGIREVYYGSPLNSSSYITPQNDLDYIYIYLNRSVEGDPNLNVEVSNLMIYEVSSATDERDYVPYVENKPAPIDLRVVTGNIPIYSSNKNLCLLSDYEVTTNGITYKFKNNRIILNGTSTAIVDIRVARLTKMLNTYGDIIIKEINDNPGTYVCSNNSGLTSYYYDVNNQYISNKIVISDSRKIKEIFVRIPSGTTFDNKDIEFQIERNENPSTFEEHKGKINILHLGNQYLLDDEKFYHKGTKWFKHKIYEKIILNGNDNEGWTLNETNTNTYRFVAANILIDKPAKYKTIESFKNDMYTQYVGNSGMSSIDSEGIAIRDDFNGITVRDLISKVTDLAGFKTYLSNNPITIYYEIEPTEEEITDIQLLADLDEIMNSYSTRTLVMSEGYIQPIIEAKSNTIYKRLEYIQSSGTQQINTEIIPTSNIKLIINYEHISGSSWIIGSRTTYQSSDSIGIFVLDNYYYEIVNPASRDITSTTNLRHKIEVSGTKFIVDNITLGTYTNSIANGTYPIYIFTMNSGNVIDGRKASGKLYSCQIYNGTTLLRDFIPVMRITDNEIGLYDLVNEKFYPNEGTGSFTGKELNLASKIDSNNILYANDFYEI